MQTMVKLYPYQKRAIEQAKACKNVVLLLPSRSYKKGFHMATATAEPPVEALPEAIPDDGVEKTRRGRNSAPTINYRMLHKTKDAAKENPPKAEIKDSEDKVIDTTEVSGFRIYKVMNIKSQDRVFVYARSSDQALAFVAMLKYDVELQDSQRVGRAKKIDTIYLMFARALKKNGQTKELADFLKEHPHYAPHLEEAA